MNVRLPVQVRHLDGPGVLSSGLVHLVADTDIVVVCV
jgi:hypothetical protein